MPWTILLAYGYGALMIILGVEAFARKGSVPSIIAGSILGLLAIGGGYLAKHHPKVGWALVGLSALAALGKSVPALINGKAFYPDGAIAILGALGLIAAIAGYLGVGR